MPRLQDVKAFLDAALEGAHADAESLELTDVSDLREDDADLLDIELFDLLEQRMRTGLVVTAAIQHSMNGSAEAADVCPLQLTTRVG